MVEMDMKNETKLASPIFDFHNTLELFFQMVPRKNRFLNVTQSL